MPARGHGNALRLLGALAATAFFGPAVADEFGFIGASEILPSYGTHCPQGSGTCAPIPKSYAVDLSGSFTDPNNWQDSNALFDPVEGHFAPRAPGPGDDVTIGGVPPGFLTPTQGPQSFTHDGEISGYYNSSGFAGYFGAGPFAVSDVGGTVASLSVHAPGTLTMGALSASDFVLLNATGPTRIYTYTAGTTDSSGDPQPGGFSSANLAVNGGSITTPRLYLTASTDLQQTGVDPVTHAGTLTITGTTISADLTSVFPTREYVPNAGSNGDVVQESQVKLVDVQLTAATQLAIVAPNIATSPFIKGNTSLVASNSMLKAGNVFVGLRADLGGTGILPGPSLPVAGAGGELDLTQSSTLTTTEGLVVGYGAAGVLSVSGGSTVKTAGAGYIGLIAGSDGSQATLSDSNSKWTTDGFFQVGANSRSTLDVLNGASFSTGELLTIGYQADGILNVKSGATLTAGTDLSPAEGSFVIGYDPNSNSIATVDGTGTKLDSHASVTVGFSGTGALTLSGGAAMTSEGLQIRVGRQAGSHGTVTITDAGTTLQAPDANLHVGDAGTGTVTVEEGGKLSANFIRVGTQATGNGTLTVTDSGSQVSAKSGVIFVGDAGTGVVTVKNGGSLVAKAVDIAAQANSSGTVSISGGGSSLVTEDGGSVLVGDQGAGSLTVRDGGNLDLRKSIVIVGSFAGSIGTLSVNSSSAGPLGGGSTLKLDGTVVVGQAGTGDLKVVGSGLSDTSSFSLEDTGRIVLGKDAGGTGTLTVTQAALDFADGQLIVGDEGNGKLVIDQATASFENLKLGQTASGTHVVTVSGTGGFLHVDGTMEVAAADSSSGELDIKDNASAFVQTLSIANHKDAVGQVFVNGNGSALHVENTLTLGTGPTTPGRSDMDSVGILAVSDGAAVDARDIIVNNGPNQGSLVLLAGSDSTLTFSTLSVVGAVTVGGSSKLIARAANSGSPGNADLRFLDGGTLLLHDSASASAGAVEVKGSSTIALQDQATTLDADYLTVTGAANGNPASMDVSGTVTVKSDTRISNGELTVRSGGIFKSSTLNVDESSQPQSTLSLSGGKLQIGQPGQISGCCAMQFGGVGMTLTGASEANVYGGFSAKGGGTNPQIAIGDSSVLNVFGDFGLTLDSSLALANAARLSLNGNGDIVNSTVTLAGSSGIDANGNDLKIDNEANVTLANQSSIANVKTLTVGAGSALTLSDGAVVSVSSHVSTGDHSTISVAQGGILKVGTDFAGQDPSSVHSGSNVYTSKYVIVGTGAVLDGTGTIYADNFLGFGTYGAAVTRIHTGHSPGTLTVSGNYEQTGNVDLEVTVGPDSYGKLVVGGTATFNGGRIVVTSEDGGQIALGQTYSFVEAAGGVSGHLDGVEAFDPFFTLTTDLSGNALTATVVYVPDSIANAAATPNQAAIAGIVNGMATTMPGGDGSTIVNALLNLGADDLRATLDDLSGEAYASTQTLLAGQAGLSRGVGLERLRSAFGGVDAAASARTFASTSEALAYADPARAGKIPFSIADMMPVAPDFSGVSIWAEPVGAWFHSGNAGNAAGASQQTGGIFFGADAPVGNWRLGLFGGYTHSNFDLPSRAFSGSSDNYDVGALAGTDWNRVALRLGADFGWHDVSVGRSFPLSQALGSPKGSFDATTAQLFGELGYRIEAGGFDIEPFAGLTYLHIATDGFAETGGAAALAVSAADADLGFSDLGVRAATEVDIAETAVRLHGSLGWRHAVGDTTPAAVLSIAGSDPFSVHGLPTETDEMGLDAGFDVDLAPRAKLGLSYNGQFGAHAADQSISAALSLAF